jgi:predicted  nucleic acid-binding Zn-ribbon protein
VADQIETDVAALKAEAETARTNQNRLQAQLESAEAETQRVLAKLREEFSVGSLEEAEELAQKIDAQLLTEMQAVRESLAAAHKPEES